MLCVKPKDLEKLVQQLNNFIKKKKIIISFIAGVNVSSISNLFNFKSSIVRFMPNLSIKYGESITAVYSSNFSQEEKKNLHNVRSKDDDGFVREGGEISSFFQC